MSMSSHNLSYSSHSAADSKMKVSVSRKKLKWFISIAGIFHLISTGVIFVQHHRYLMRVRKPAEDNHKFDIPRQLLAKEALKLQRMPNEDPMSSYSLAHHKFHSYLYHGKVMNEFCNRVLHRSVAQSNTLIVSPDVNHPSIIEVGEDPDVSKIQAVHRIQKDGPAEVVVSHSVREGHATHVLPANTNLNDWWNSNETKQRNATWFLLSVFLTGNDNGDNIHQNIDELLSPSRAKDLFQGATMTYVVIGVRSIKKVKIGKNKQGDSDSTTEILGLTAIQTLLDAKYKVQLLSSSHFGETGGSYHHNHLFKTTEDAKQFLSSGAEMAAGTGEHFEALLFATQGLDLAIPSRLSYVDIGELQVCKARGAEATGRCDSKLDARALGNDIFLSCPAHHSAAKIRFVKNKNEQTPTNIDMTLDDESIVEGDGRNVELWMGHENASLAETACMRGSSKSYPNQLSVSCATRILKKPVPANDELGIPPQALHSGGTSDEQNSGGIKRRMQQSSKKRNLLVILIDPISRSQFQRSLPNTAALLKKKGYVHFEKYTAVGNNSGPNQSALYTGLPLVGGRDGIKNSASHGGDNKKSSTWLWDQLELAGYVTLKAEDSCVENSNMVQSMKPQTTHGEQLSRMFCFDFDRPNCLGKQLTAKHLIDYTRKFIDAYGDEGSDDPRPWAAFLSFVDSHEDSLTVISYLDSLLFHFLLQQDLSDTLVVFTSDHGLHYGPSFQSNGERERAEPILYLHAPPVTGDAMGTSSMKVLKANSKYYTTPFDLHETIVDITMGKKENTDRLGASLVESLPDSRRECRKTPGIPDRFCSLLSPSVGKPKKCTFMNKVPSALSFYADIPRKNRPSWPKCYKKEKKLVHAPDNCQCAAFCKREGECLRECGRLRLAPDQVPMQNPLNMTMCPLRKAPHYTVDLNININTNKEIEQRHLEKQSLLTNNDRHKLEPMPNILFLEVDSLSESAAMRHIPKTISVLKSHQIIQTEESNKLLCPTGFCAAMFSKTSVVGQNSIPNQLAALSGCSDRVIPGVSSYLRPRIDQFTNRTMETWCPKGDVENPFLFDVVKDLGYATFFGEEFCYSNSPYVIQDNMFKLDADYNLKDVFCRLSKGVLDFTKSKEGIYVVEHDTSKRPDPCVGGRSRQELAFEYIRGIWDAYPNTPKFAYINSLAAHDYSIDLAYQALGLEAYDDYLSAFLQEMLQRPDAKDTIIVLRSDHGLQGGPSPVDFSFQVEHMHPFNNLIVPEKFRGLSLDALFANQDKLVTGFDLYKTLRSVLTPKLKEGNAAGLLRKREIVKEVYNNGSSSPSSSNHHWSYNLLQDTVSEERTCDDAKIPREFCPCMEEREDLMPYFYVGHAENAEKMEEVSIVGHLESKVLKVHSAPGYSMSRLIGLKSSIMEEDDDNELEIDDIEDEEDAAEDSSGDDAVNDDDLDGNGNDDVDGNGQNDERGEVEADDEETESKKDEDNEEVQNDEVDDVNQMDDDVNVKIAAKIY